MNRFLKFTGASVSRTDHSEHGCRERPLSKKLVEFDREPRCRYRSQRANRRLRWTFLAESVGHVLSGPASQPAARQVITRNTGLTCLSDRPPISLVGPGERTFPKLGRSLRALRPAGRRTIFVRRGAANARLGLGGNGGRRSCLRRPTVGGFTERRHAFTGRPSRPFRRHVDADGRRGRAWHRHFDAAGHRLSRSLFRLVSRGNAGRSHRRRIGER
jgi:hypothetical protein